VARTRADARRLSWLALGALGVASCRGQPPAGEGTSDHLELASPAIQPERQQAASEAASEHLEARRRMVDQQLRGRDIRDERVLRAMLRVPRHRFVPTGIRSLAYLDRPLPIGWGQTISQPYIVAYMTEAAQVAADDTVLEVGTGSGYQAAVLHELAAAVYTIEIVPGLAARARETLAELGYDRVHVRTGDGYAGWPEHAPFDAIVVTAAPDHVPPALVEQLAVGGRLVIPVGTTRQEMLVISRDSTGATVQRTIPVRFVPLVRKPGPDSSSRR
jgi:protein-L-isoaspartate(D-aspartate) O-methyltransferase